VKSIFDDDAELYDAIRPGYPAALVDDIIALSALPPGGRILEVACGTGQATRAFAARGYPIVAVELGENMAAVARRQLAQYPAVEIRVGAFEEAELPPASFALAISATAFHWIDAARGLPKIADALAPGGSVALFWNEHVRGDDDVGFFDAVQKLYERAGMPRWPLRTVAEVQDRSGDIVASGRFGPVTVRRHAWQESYDAERYVQLLSTYSDHRRLSLRTRAELLDGIRTLVEQRFGGRIVKSYAAVLYHARLATPAATPVATRGH
jgi:SAM-dependent methyltransferase